MQTYKTNTPLTPSLNILKYSKPGSKHYIMAEKEYVRVFVKCLGPDNSNHSGRQVAGSGK